MADAEQKSFALWKEKHETLWQFIMFALMGLITTVVDFGSFALFNFWIFVRFRNQPFSWWLIDYSIPNGGLTAFLSFACSYALAQTFNFFLQRKATFKSNNNVARSAIMYAIMNICVYVLQLYLPTLIRAPIAMALGPVFGDIVVKTINMTSSMLIQFPLSKWLIMKRT